MAFARLFSDKTPVLIVPENKRVGSAYELHDEPNFRVTSPVPAPIMASSPVNTPGPIVLSDASRPTVSGILDDGGNEALVQYLEGHPDSARFPNSLDIFNSSTNTDTDTDTP